MAINKKKVLAPIDRKPDNPKRLYMTYEEAREDSKNWRKAMKVREDAFKQEMAKANIGQDPEIDKAEASVLRDKQLVKACTNAVNQLQEELKEAEGTEKTRVKKEIKKAQDRLDDAIAMLAKSQDALEDIKK